MLDATEETLGTFGLGIPRDEGTKLPPVAVMRSDEVGELVDEHVVDDPQGHSRQTVGQPDGASTQGA